MSNNENIRTHIRQHYIPQFILKNFSFNDRGELFYYSSNDKIITKTNTRDIFMESCLYDSAKINSSDPSQIEKDFSKYEGEIAHLIKEKILHKADVVLTHAEAESLKLFIALLSFRSKRTGEKFSGKLSDASKQMYSPYQPNGDFNELWKRNLRQLVNCRSLEEIMQKEEIDHPIKLFMNRDTCGWYGTYLSFMEVRGKYDLVLSDAYPTTIFGDSIKNPIVKNIPIFSILPLTPTFVLFLVYNGAEACQGLTDFKPYMKRPPIKKAISKEKNLLVHHVRKIYDLLVCNLNHELIKNSETGIVFQNRERISLE